MRVLQVSVGLDRRTITRRFFLHGLLSGAFAEVGSTVAESIVK